MLLQIRDTIHKLQHEGANTSFPIVSLYLAIRLPTPLPQDLIDRFRSLVKREISDDKKRLEQDIDYIDAYLQQFTNPKQFQGIALFSGGNTVWEVINTPFTLPDKLVVDHSPYLFPLLEQLEEYARYLVILADRGNARAFTLYRGLLEDETEIHDETVAPTVEQKIKGQNDERRDGKINRHMQDHLNHHFSHIADIVEQFIEKKPLNGVVIGGHKEIIHILEKHLPKYLQEKIIAEFSAEPDASLNDLVIKSKDVLQSVTKKSLPNPSSHFTPQ